MMKYLVTGSTGFVGSRLLGFLNTIKCDVRLLSRSEISDHETVLCSLGKDRIPGHTLESVDTVFHLAGFAHDMQDSSKVEDLYRVINVEATVELARLAIESGIKRFVFVSSFKAGGLPISEHCASEEEQNDPEGFYGKTKRIATDGTSYSSREIYNAMCSALDKSILKWNIPKFLFDMDPR